MPRRPATAALLALALVAGGSARAETADPNGFTVVSANADFEASQVSQGTTCQLEVRKGATVLWSLKRCLGDRNDAHFLSNDGMSLMVVYTFPSQSAGPKAASALAIYFKGAPTRLLEVGRFVRDVKPLIMARSHFYWLEGAMGQPGVPPGLSKDGSAVELTTLDRRSWSVGFDGKFKKIDMPKPLGH